MSEFYLYPIKIETCEEGGYFASCSVLQGCYTEGETYAETINNIEGVIRAHIEDRKARNEFIPSIIVGKPAFKSISIPVPIRV